MVTTHTGLLTKKERGARKNLSARVFEGTDIVRAPEGMVPTDTKVPMKKEKERRAKDCDRDLYVCRRDVVVSRGTSLSWWGSIGMSWSAERLRRVQHQPLS